MAAGFVTPFYRRRARIRPMRRTPLVVCLAALCIVAGRAQSPTPEDLVKQGRALVSQGKLDEAISVYRKAIKIAPQSFDARLAIGIVLDLQGQYAEARTHLTDAIRFAPAGARNQAMTAMAISYAFESRAPEVLKYFEPVYKQQLADQDMGGAAATANAMGRVYLGDGRHDERPQVVRDGIAMRPADRGTSAVGSRSLGDALAARRRADGGA